MRNATPDAIANGIGHAIAQAIGHGIGDALGLENATPLPLTPYPFGPFPPPTQSLRVCNGEWVQRPQAGNWWVGEVSTTDQTRAVQALAYRLRDWDVPDADEKAHEFITALVGVGWEMGQRGARPPRPPKPHEACRDCGRHFDACLCDGGPTISPHLPAPDPSAKVALLKAIRDEVAGGQCSHHVARNLCADCKPSVRTEGDPNV